MNVAWKSADAVSKFDTMSRQAVFVLSSRERVKNVLYQEVTRRFVELLQLKNPL